MRVAKLYADQPQNGIYEQKDMKKPLGSIEARSGLLMSLELKEMSFDSVT
jgi:hypothetical protein